jgi:hypothetical protein
VSRRNKTITIEKQQQKNIKNKTTFSEFSMVLPMAHWFLTEYATFTGQIKFEK